MVHPEFQSHTIEYCGLSITFCVLRFEKIKSCAEEVYAKRIFGVFWASASRKSGLLMGKTVENYD